MAVRNGHSSEPWPAAMNHHITVPSPAAMAPILTDTLLDARRQCHLWLTGGPQEQRGTSRTNGDPSPAISRSNSRPLSYPPSDRGKTFSAQMPRMPVADMRNESMQISPSSEPLAVHANEIEETAAPMAPITPPDNHSAENVKIIYDNIADVDEQSSHPPPSVDMYPAEGPEWQENTSDGGHRQWVELQGLEALLYKFIQRNLQTRAITYGERSKLRESRLQISAADEAFMKVIRYWWTEVADEQEKVQFKDSFNRLQATRNTYGPLEEAYNELEDRLDREEYEVTVLAGQVAEYRTRSYQEQDKDRQPLFNNTDADSLARSEAIEESSPLYDKYLSKQGDEDLLLEAHADLVMDYERLRDIQEIRQRLGTDLLLEDQEAINNFPAEEAQILEQLRGVREEVEGLRQAWIREGLPVNKIPVHPSLDINEIPVHPSSDVDEIPVHPSSDVDKIPVPTGSAVDRDTDILENQDGYIDLAEYIRFPLLLEKPEDKGDLEKSKSLISTFKQGDKGDRITRWLLHKLRSSYSEVELLARYASDQEGRITDPDKSLRWQEEVLGFWFVDDANHSTSEFKFEPSTSSLPASPHSPYDLAIAEGTLVAGNGATLLPRRALTLTDLATGRELKLLVRQPSRSELLEFQQQLQLKRRRHTSCMTV